MSVLSAQNLAVTLSGRTILPGVDLTLSAGERVALIGPNGAGKTTLVNALCGQVRAKGTITLDGTDVTRASAPARARAGLARTFQITSLFPGLSVMEALRLATLATLGRGGAVAVAADTVAEANDAATAQLGALGLSNVANSPIETLPHGTQRLVELALALAAAPKVLLLDEPAAGAASETLGAMARAIDSVPPHVAILLVEHNLAFAFARVSRVVVLVAGKIIADGSPAAIRADPAVQRAYLGHG
ncbi:MAG: ATP-binding cassette domain-containing protein [Pseudomonadota bacterium]